MFTVFVVGMVLATFPSTAGAEPDEQTSKSPLDTIPVQLGNGRVIQLLMPGEHFGMTWADAKKSLPEAMLICPMPDGAGDLEVIRELYTHGRAVQKAYYPFYNKIMGFEDGPADDVRAIEEVIQRATEGKLGERRKKVLDRMDAISFWNGMLNQTMIAQGFYFSDEWNDPQASREQRAKAYRLLSESNEHDGEFFRDFAKAMECAN